MRAMVAGEAVQQRAAHPNGGTAHHVHLDADCHCPALKPNTAAYFVAEGRGQDTFRPRAAAGYWGRRRAQRLAVAGLGWAMEQDHGAPGSSCRRDSPSNCSSRRAPARPHRDPADPRRPPDAKTSNATSSR